MHPHRMGGLTLEGAEGAIVNCVAGDDANNSWDGRSWPAPKHLSSFDSFPVMPENCPRSGKNA